VRCGFEQDLVDPSSNFAVMEQKVTLVLGASTKPGRYANLAVESLVQKGIPVIAVGLRSGTIGTVSILTGMPTDVPVHTLSLYVGAAHHAMWTERIMALSPKRIIFNPGAEGRELEERARNAGIEVVHGCTLVMLRVGTY
jgi:predicted CoA-binding protein